MREMSRKRLSAVLLVVATGFFVLGIALLPGRNNTASAAAPLQYYSQVAAGIQGKLEGQGAEVRPTAPQYRTAPSIFKPLDPDTNPSFSPNVRANTDNTLYAQQESSIAVNPLNSLNVIASAKDERSAPAPGTSTKEVWEYASTDGGITWVNSHAPLAGPDPVHQSDPVNIFRDDGVAYACYLGYSDAGGFTDTGVYVARSTDGGITWTNPVVAVNEAGGYSTDKQWLAVDNNPASPFYHRMYLSWTEFGGCNGCIHFVYSTDQGNTWSPRTFQLSSSSSGQQFSMPTVLWNGTVFVNWAQNGTIFYRLSTDGGITWSTQATAGTMNTNLAMTGQNWRISAIPVAAANRATPANLVIVWNDGRNNATGGVDTYYIRSTNGGTAWSAPARLNDDPAGVVKHQAEPWVTTSPNGTFHSIWYDERDDSSANVVFNIYYTQSTDGGVTWSQNVRASDGTSNLNVGIPSGPGWNGAAGDYIGLAATNTEVYGDWTDTRSGTNEDIYMFRGILAGGPTPTPTATAVPPTLTPTLTATASPTATSTTTSTPTAQTVLRGHVLLQGRPPAPDNRWSVPVTLTLRSSDGTDSEYAAATDTSGYFTVTAPAPGTYAWRVKNPQTLAMAGSTTLVVGTNTVEMGTLPEGDANNDNCANVSDTNILKNTLGKSVGNPGYDPRADFNGDNTVSVLDFNLLRADFGICGAGPVR